MSPQTEPRIDHRVVAETLLSHVDLDKPASDPFAAGLTLQAAVVHALLALESRMAELANRLTVEGH